ncbi:hypothetical protein ACFL2S_13415 [Thermodesulfobacteriota bacterium]
MPKDMIFAEVEEFYNDLRDEPCIVCGDPYQYVSGSFTPDETSRFKKRGDKPPILYYTLCEKCFNKGRIPTANIEAVYKSKFGKLAA